MRFWFKKKYEIEQSVKESERRRNGKDRLAMIQKYEYDLDKQARIMREEFKVKMAMEMKKKDAEISDLKKIIDKIKNEGKAIQLLSAELEFEFKSVSNISAGFGNKFTNIESKAHRSVHHIDKIEGRVLK